MNIETEIYKRLINYGFKNHKCEHNKRLGILRTFITEDGSKFVEIINRCDSYYSVLFYGLSRQYLPISVDVMLDEDLDYLDAFLKENINVPRSNNNTE